MCIARTVFRATVVAVLVLSLGGCCLPMALIHLMGNRHGGSDAKHTVTAQSQTRASQTTCPVTDAKVNRALFVDHAGKRIYVCCSECIPSVGQDPERYIRRLEEKSIILDTVSTPTDAAQGTPAEHIGCQ